MRGSKEIVWLAHRLDRPNVSDNRSKAYLKRVLMKFFLLDKQIWFHSSGSELKNHTVLPAYKICHSEYSDNQISSSLWVKNICSVIGGGSAVARVPNDLQLHLIPHIISQQQKMKNEIFHTSSLHHGTKVAPVPINQYHIVLIVARYENRDIFLKKWKISNTDL